jgi:hypothetical protein
MRRNILTMIAAAAMVCLFSSQSSASSYLVEQGVAAGKILTPPNPSPEMKLAADELAEHLRRMTGAQFEVAADPGGPLPKGSIRLAISAEAAKASVRDGSDQSFVIDQTGHGLLIEGNSDLAVLYGAYEYLAGLGVRWFTPGDLGRHAPTHDSIALSGERKQIKPGFRLRSLWLNGNPDWHLDGSTPEKLTQQRIDHAYWQLRNRMQFNYRAPRKGTLPFPLAIKSIHEVFNHNVAKIYQWKKLTLEKNPERFPLVTRDGQKVRIDKGQICFTHPDNISDAAAWCLDYFEQNPSMITASMSLQDTGGVCECENCTKTNDGVNPSERCDRLVWGFMNEVARRVAEKRPDRGIAFFSSYGATMMPLPGTKAQGNILGVVCHIDHNNHDLEDPACPNNQLFLQQIAALKATGAEAVAYDYTTFPASLQPLMILNNVKTYHKLGLSGYTCEIMTRSAQHTMVNWAQAQLAWNPDQEPRKLIVEYCNTYFGDAGADVLAVVDAVEASICKLPKLTLSGYGASQEIMTDDVVAFARKKLEQATTKVSGIYAQRLTQFRDTIEFYSRLAEAYRALYVAIEDRTPATQQEAVAKFDLAKAYWNEHNLAQTCSPTIVPGWIDRVRNTAVTIPPINAAPYKTLVNGDETTLKRELFSLDQVPDRLEGLTFLPSQWKFRMDMGRRGEANGWMKPEFDDSHWVSLGNNFFDDQGFLRYEGTFWYRTAFDAPAVPAGKRVYMRFGALDDDGKIYINGKLAYERIHLLSNDWQRSFEFDATDFIKPGQKNTVAVCGRNDYGKGGLWKPVAVYLRN